MVSCEPIHRKRLAALQSSIDSMTYRVDSIGNNYANSLKVSGYFALYDRPGMHVSKEDSIREQKAVAEAAELNLESLFDGGSLQRKQLYSRSCRGKSRTI